MGFDIDNLDLYINKEDKAHVVFLFSFISIITFLISTKVATIVFDNFISFIIGIVLILMAIPFHILGKRNIILYFISFAINSIANGLSVATYYIVKGIALDYSTISLAVIPALIILFLNLLLFKKNPRYKRNRILFITILILAIAVASIYFWITTNGALYSFMAFNMMIVIFYTFVFMIPIAHECNALLRSISFASFGSYLILTIVVAAILSEGDILSGFDIPISGKKKRKLG